MQVKAKDILQKSIEFGLGFFVILIVSCKSSENTSLKIEESPELEIGIRADIEEEFDRLKTLELIDQKEKEISNYKASATRNFDLIHTDLELDFDYQNQTVLGKAILTIKPYFKSQKEITLDAKDFEVGKIFFVEKADSTSLAYFYDGQQLRIFLPKEVSREDTFDLAMAYTAFPEKNSGNGSQAITDTKGLYFIDPGNNDPLKQTMIWTQGETSHNSKWFPTIDHPNERMTQLFKLTVPDSMISVGNGELVNKKDLGNGFHMDYWEMKKPHAPYLAAFAIGNFGKVEAKWGDIPLGYFVEKGYEKGAEIVFQNTPEMLSFFSQKLGLKFPWPKYDQVVVKDFVSGAMENTTVSIFMEELKLTENEALDSEWDYIIAHELFHQWFGDFVTTESWANLTLNEGFANYSEYLWNEHKYGKDQAALKLVAEMETYFEEALNKKVNLIRYQYQNSEDMFDSHSYSKGGVILHMLRRYLGEEAFFEGLNLYLNKHALSTVEVHDLRQAFEEVTGEDLNWFFNQWYFGKGHPELYVEIDYSIPDNILISLTQIQNLEISPLFQLPFEVSWYDEGKRKVKRFMLKEAFQQFALENGKATDLVFFDEGKDLLLLRTQQNSKEQWKKQFETSELGIARYEALDSLVSLEAFEELELMIPKIIKDDFWAIRELGLGILQSHSQWLFKSPSLEKEVFGILKADTKNSVRAGAIDVLSTYDPEKYQQTFVELVDAKSVIVASSALMGLTSIDGQEISEDLIERFSDENNFRFIIPISEYFISKPVLGKGIWFNSKINSLSGEGLFYFLGYYGEYFSRFPEEGKPTAVDNLKKIMKDDPQKFIRMGAFQAILAFLDDPQVLKDISEIAIGEKDPELKSYYEYFIDALNDEN